MKEVAQIHKDELERIQKAIKNSHSAFRENYDRYQKCIRFVYESSLTNDDINLLQSMSRPQLTFNRLEAFVSRLLGEFSKQEPDISVNSFDKEKADPLVIRVVEQHLVHVFSDDINENLRYQVYKDLLAGGFSAVKVYTDYEHSMSMKQSIRFQRCEPTLTGFDTTARLPSKGDGRFCFELYPKSKEEFEQEYPHIKVDNLDYKRSFAGFNWSYINDNTETILVCDYYEKKLKKETIMQLSDGQVVTKKQYQKIVEEWPDITMPPVPVGDSRVTTTETIVRYRMIEDEVLEYEETDFEMLPIVFIDGNSIMVATNNNGNVRQMTRPYVYHAMDMQRFIDYAGNAWAYELQNTLSHKIMVAKEALPQEAIFRDAYTDIQTASTLVFNSVHNGNPETPIMNPIREVQRMPMPPEISQAFMSGDAIIQGILGNYDASLGINDNQLSGVAIVEAASQSNSAAMPYIVGCLQGFQRLAEIYVNLMPKYFVTPSTLPVIDGDGKRHFVKINQEEGIDMNFDTKGLNVSLTAGASFQVQKSRTINMLKDMMGMSPLFSQFIAEKGLNFVLDNMEGHGIDELKELTKGWVEEYQKQKEAAMQAEKQESQQNPAAIKAQVDMQKLQVDAKDKEKKIEIEVGKLQLEHEKLRVNTQLTKESLKVQMLKAAMDQQSKASDLHVRKVDVSASHHHNNEKLKHDMVKHIMTVRSKPKA